MIMIRVSWKRMLKKCEVCYKCCAFVVVVESRKSERGDRALICVSSKGEFGESFKKEDSIQSVKEGATV